MQSTASMTKEQNNERVISKTLDFRRTSNFNVYRLTLNHHLISPDPVNGLAHVVPLVVVARLLDHQLVLVAPLQHLLRGQLLEPAVLGDGVALGRAGQDGPVVDSHGVAGLGGHAENLGRD